MQDVSGGDLTLSGRSLWMDAHVVLTCLGRELSQEFSPLPGGGDCQELTATLSSVSPSPAGAGSQAGSARGYRGHSQGGRSQPQAGQALQGEPQLRWPLGLGSGDLVFLSSAATGP